MARYIFITGGVVSGLGKGITAASLGRLLIDRGLTVTVQKLDPYINVDPGTMNPYEHGEVFVTDDGTETDLDIGHYERFLGVHFTRDCNYTTGKIYSSVIAKERNGEYLGKTIQVVPHITNEIINAMKSVAGNNDIVIVEIGGTVGDLESGVYIEAIRQFRQQLGFGNSVSIHVTLVPHLDCSGEIKTKPTQASVREIAQLGVTPDLVVCRTGKDVELDLEHRKKIAMFCNLAGAEYVIHNRDCRSIYEVPLLMKEQKLDDLVLGKLGMNVKKGDMKEWRAMVSKMLAKHETKTVAIVGKYIEVADAYISVTEAVKHAGLKCGVSVNVKLVDCEKVDLKGVDGIIVPGGFGSRGIEGKIAAAKFARENKIPYLGLCLGMQIATIEFARNVAGLKGANSSEIDAVTPYPVIDIMESQKNIDKKGGTMRLGLYDCTITPKTNSAKLYGKKLIRERHRHRYEFNNAYREQLEKAGLVIAGVNENNNLVEIIEIPNHPYFVAAQFHPEFLSKPYQPHPLFVGLMKAVKEKK